MWTFQSLSKVIILEDTEMWVIEDIGDQENGAQWKKFSEDFDLTFLILKILIERMHIQEGIVIFQFLKSVSRTGKRTRRWRISFIRRMQWIPFIKHSKFWNIYWKYCKKIVLIKKTSCNFHIANLISFSSQTLIPYHISY